jgi:hypothetical protein
MAVKECSHKLRMFFPGQVFFSHDKEPSEFKQSRSNGCLGSSDISALKKHISLEKIIQGLPSKQNSKTCLKKSSKQLGRGSAKVKEGETPSEARFRMGFKSYKGNSNDIGSPLTPSRAVPLSSDPGKVVLNRQGINQPRKEL